MAQFKIAKWREIWASPYQVIMEMEKTLDIAAKPVGDTYLVTAETQGVADQLRGITSLAGKQVTLEELLPEDKPCIYMIVGVPVDVPDVVLLGMIPRVNKVERQTRYDFSVKKGVPTGTIKVWARGEIPTTVEMGSLGERKTRRYIPDPMRCYKCQQYGHRQKSCRNRPRCSYCSLGHETTECRNKVKANEEVTRKCVNCGGEHSARSNSCPIWKKKAQETRARFLATVQRPVQRQEQREQQQPPPPKTTGEYPTIPNPKTVTIPAKAPAPEPAPAPAPALNKPAQQTKAQQLVIIDQERLQSFLIALAETVLTASGFQGNKEPIMAQVQQMASLLTAPAIPSTSAWNTTPSTPGKVQTGTPADLNIEKEKAHLSKKRQASPTPPGSDSKENNSKRTKDAPAETATPVPMMETLETEYTANEDKTPETEAATPAHPLGEQRTTDDNNQSTKF